MLYQCPECKEVSDSTLWEETEVGCEDCGSHPALRCPKCDTGIDMIFYNTEDLESKPEIYREEK